MGEEFWQTEAINAVQLIMTTHRLKKSGKFEKFSEDPTVILGDDFAFESYLEAKQWKHSQSTVEIDSETIEVNPSGIGLGETYFDIRSHRISKPKQKVFTRDQLRSVLLRGNDDLNNSLVVDKDGYIQLVPFRSSNDAGYPVRFETFQAGNRYVGSESALNHLESTYIALLEGWSEHLASGDIVYRDYTTGESEEELLKAISEEFQKYQ